MMMHLDGLRCISMACTGKSFNIASQKQVLNSQLTRASMFIMSLTLGPGPL